MRTGISIVFVWDLPLKNGGTLLAIKKLNDLHHIYEICDNSHLWKEGKKNEAKCL